MRTRLTKKNQQGFTLVELMIVVAIIGILAVLAVYGVSKYMVNAKTGEARNSLGQIAKSAVGAYEEERAPGELVAPGSQSTNVLHAFCATAAPVPAAVPVDKKYQSAITDWGGTKDTGWQCLKFSLTEPQYFRYQYIAADTAVGFVAAADAQFGSTVAANQGFTIKGKVVSGTVTVDTAIREATVGTLADVTPP